MVDINAIIGKYGNGVKITLKIDGTEVPGVMYGNDECFDLAGFFQYFISGEKLYKAYYAIDPECEDLGKIDYTSPESIIESNDFEKTEESEAIEK